MADVPLTGPPSLPYKGADILVTIGTSGPGVPPVPLAVPGSRRSLGTTTVRPRPIPSDPGSSRLPCLLPLLSAAVAVVLLATPGWAQEQKEVAYRAFPYIGSRLAIWVIAQIHLNFAAFILGVPIFAVIIEFMGWRIGMDREEGRRYDWLSHEFVKLTFAAFSTTALLGGLLLFLLITLYPRFWAFMSGIFAPTMWLYAGLFFAETFTVYLWYYGWDWLSGPRKWIHVGLGVLSNLFGTAILVVANSWVTFMMSPAGIDESGALKGGVWAAINNYSWMPINIHRLLANIVFGGTIAGAYAAFRFLAAKTDEERARYDWMGYVGNFVALSAFIVLPFAGYYLGREIYAFNQTMGITMMGGFMSWLWIIQAILIGILFLGSNYYLWLGMERIPGAERYRKYVPPMLIVLTIGFMVWATPRSMVVTLDEARAMGGTHHPLLGFFGVMSAKNTVVNLMILTTFLSYILYRRANRESTRSWVKTGMAIQWAAFGAAAVIVVFYGVYGYFVESIVRIGFSVYQVLAVLGAIAVVMAIDVPMFKGARSTGAIRWGTIAPRSQYVLILLAVTFTWLMGLMGFARSGIRQHWHVYGVLRDTSVDAVTPALGYAANVITLVTLAFFALVMFIFWLGGLGEKGKEGAHGHAAAPILAGGSDRDP
jgi:cytochrome bd ubiquinol oxidase subunit I